MRLGVVIPCFNEEEVLTETKNRLERLLGEMIEGRRGSEDSFICFVDDGSRDKTLGNLIEEFAQRVNFDRRVIKGFLLRTNLLGNHPRIWF